MNPSGRVVVVGTLNVDDIWQVAALPRPGQTILAQSVQRQFGGKGANQAVAAARQGAQVALVGAVGDDADGAAYCDYLKREGIDVAHLARVDGISTGTAHVYVDATGENLIVVNPGANARLDPAGSADLLQQARVLLIQLECGLPAVVAALRLAARSGTRVILNASPSDRAFPWGEFPVECLVVNEHECRDCCGQSPKEIEGLSAVTRRQLLDQLRVSHLVVTRGADTTLHVTPDSLTCVPTFPVTPVDTVGAGDTFAGALAAELAADREWDAAIRHANTAAALSTLTLGAQAAMPTRAQVIAALAAAPQ